MRNQLRVLVVSMMMVGMASCAWTAQEVRLRPTPRIQPGGIGGGRSVFVNVVDERPSTVIGHRAANNIGAQITAGDEVVRTIRDSVTSNLTQLGFKPVDRVDGGGVELRTEVRNLTYLVSTGFWSGGLDVDVSMKGICIVGIARPYEHLYRGEYDDRVQVVQSAARNEEYINIALTRALEEMLGDTALMNCLASK